MSSQPTPFSIKSAKGKLFQELGRPSSNFFSDDFVQGNFETIKIKGNSPKDGFWEYKGSTKVEATKKDWKASFEDEMRVFFPINDRYSFWFGSRRKDPELKFHVDFGNVKVANRDVNLFSNVKASRDFKKVQFRFGANYFTKDLEINSRLESCNQNFFCFTNRLFHTHNNFALGFIGSLCLKTFQLTRYDLLLGYEKKGQFGFFFKHLSDAVCCNPSTTSGEKKCCLNIGKLNCNLQVFKGDQTYAAEVEVAAKDLCCSKKACEEGSAKKCCPVNFKLGASTKVNNKLTVKAKIDQAFVFANSLKYKVNDKLTVTASYELPTTKLLKLPEQLSKADAKIFPLVPFGVQFDLNI